jgi:hypothetical protein
MKIPGRIYRTKQQSPIDSYDNWQPIIKPDLHNRNKFLMEVVKSLYDNGKNIMVLTGDSSSINSLKQEYPQSKIYSG